MTNQKSQLVTIYTQDGAQVPISIQLCSAKINFIIHKNYRTTEDLTNKVVTSTLDIVGMQEKRKDAEYIIRKIHVKPINVAIKYVTKSLQRIADMEAPTNFRQDDYTFTKIPINKRTEEHSEEKKRMTEHITNLITEIALLNPEINIKVNNLVKVHLNELDELILKKDKMKNYFHMS